MLAKKDNNFELSVNLLIYWFDSFILNVFLKIVRLTVKFLPNQIQLYSCLKILIGKGVDWAKFGSIFLHRLKWLRVQQPAHLK